MFPTVIAGIEGIGRGQDRESLMMFLQTVSQALGPESMMKFVDPEEAIKRLAAAQGIDTVKLVKTAEQRQQEDMQARQTMAQGQLLQQAGQFAKAPMMDPQKNPEAAEMMQSAVNGLSQQSSQPQ